MLVICDSTPKLMQRAIAIIIIDRLMSMFTKSTIYIPPKFTVLATQKNILLTNTEEIPDFYI